MYRLLDAHLPVVPRQGTGGTISGTSSYLRSVKPDVKVILSDPEGSGLFNKVKYGVMFDLKEKEGSKRR
jgi:cysteine synthase A